jgi:hypothetical protein
MKPFKWSDITPEMARRMAEAEEGCEDFGAGAEVVDVAGYLRSFGPVEDPVQESFTTATESLLKELDPRQDWPASLKEGLVQEVLGFARQAAWSRLREVQEAA